MPKPPPNLVPDYAPPYKRPRRPICNFAATSLILGMLAILINGMSDGALIESGDLDNLLRFSARGMFFTKLLLFDSIPLISAALALWSIHRLRLHPSLSSLAVAAIALCLSLYLIIQTTNTIYHLYNGYL